MNPDLVDKVLKYITSGKDIPDIPGVWTAEDDRCLEGTDARAIERLSKKHGAEYFDTRFEYLSMTRAEAMMDGR